MLMTMFDLFIVFCASLILASTLRDEKKIEKCSKISCPPAAATICVKIKERNTQRRYVMMSKCELKLIKCLGDMNTTVVTTKYCNALRQGDMSDDQKNEPEIAWHKSGESPHEKEPVGQENPDKELNPHEISKEDSIAGYKSGESSHEKEPVGQENPDKELNPDEIPKEDEPTGQKEFNEESDTSESRLGDPVNVSSPPGTQQEENPVGHEDPTKEPELVEIQPDHEEVNDDSDGEKKELDLKKDEEQSGSACPETCPTRARRLVCARCSHGVYRTFLSPCFMRMYQCKHPNEKLELVSRRACTASAPYLGEMPRPSSEVVEPQYDDIVLNHIYGMPNFK